MIQEVYQLRLTYSLSIQPRKPQSGLHDEPDLISRIGARAQDATNPEAAEHFDAAAQKLENAYQQDKEWISKHPEQGDQRV